MKPTRPKSSPAFRQRLLTRWIPLVSLTLLSALVLRAMTSSPPPLAAFPEPPEIAPLPVPDLALGAATLRGVVVDTTGRPIVDVGLVALLETRVAWTWTDSDGRFVLTEVPARTLELATLARGFEPTRLTAAPGPSEVQLVLTRRIDAPPELPSLAALALAGRVTFTPLEDADGDYELALLPVLGLDRIDSGLPSRAPVARDGSFWFEALPPGEYEVLLLPPEARGGTWPNLLENSAGMAPRHTQPAPGGAATEGPQDPIALDVRSRAGGLEGRLSSRSKSGTATWLAGALVQVEPTDSLGVPIPSRVVWTTSDAEGAYRLRHLPPGRYRVLLAAGEERRERAVLIGERALVNPDL